MNLPAREEAMWGVIWRSAEEYGDASLERCRAFMPVPGPLQTVWGSILALQAFWPGHTPCGHVHRSVVGSWLLV